MGIWVSILLYSASVFADISKQRSSSQASHMPVNQLSHLHAADLFSPQFLLSNAPFHTTSMLTPPPLYPHIAHHVGLVPQVSLHCIKHSWLRCFSCMCMDFTAAWWIHSPHFCFAKVHLVTTDCTFCEGFTSYVSDVASLVVTYRSCYQSFSYVFWDEPKLFLWNVAGLLSL